ncbi:hypothetical protein RJ639_035895 [Escallonia herrerae]|uniref:GAG-pre-integrase domain-containing protein n=1 Tax=Escallonia herrerae TaxID=1293975 RepID=A0AA89BDE8_9ASTE|nr:hypothetical protein RJ639_035895 [Escallonia herrerae]
MGIGTIKIKIFDGIVRTLGDVRYIPDLKKNLISLGTLDSIDCSIFIKGGVMKVSKGAMVIMKGQKIGNLYKLIGNTVIGGASVSTHTSSSNDNSELWHKRLGHLSEGGMLELHKRKLLQGVKSCKLDFCKFCVFGKQKRVNFKIASHTSKGVLDYIHSDVWGPIKHISNGGARYFVTFIDDFSRKNEERSKLDPKSKECIFLGHEEGVKGYRLWDPVAKKKVLERFSMLNAKPVSTPLGAHFQLSSQLCPSTKEDVEYMSRVPYANVVGCLMYAMVCTRPDISHAVSMVSRYMGNSGKKHWDAVKWIFRYLAGSTNFGIMFDRDGAKGEVFGFVDSDYVGDLDSRRSMTGYVFTFYRGPICWKSVLQSTTALSTTEAEYMALTEAAKEALWLKGLVEELGFKQRGVLLQCDS